MSEQHQQQIGTEDPKALDAWRIEWDEWIAQGLGELERYLANQAAFADFLRARAEV